MLRWTSAPTPLGELVVVVSDVGVVRTAFFDGEPHTTELGDARRTDRGLAALRRELAGYFAGTVLRFATPVDLSLTTGRFARSVLGATVRVPYGELRTYGDVAAAAGRPRAARAAGTALRHCPIELWVPCHRVVPAGPGFGSYGGHPERREFLLRLEGAI